jgi:signal transduction histidine kinase/CheY-like chemotaxis protein
MQGDGDFLADGGEMGAIIRDHDWASSPLGPPAEWPQALKTAMRLLLSTGHPMFIWWGPELIQFYNDAYRRSIGPERHPSAIGQRGRECWAEIWDIIGPQIELVMAGKGYTWHENQLVPITRGGKREDVYWTYSYGPIDDPSAPHGDGGVLVVCTETTEHVLAEQRMKAAEGRWRALFAQAPGFVAILSGPEHVFEFANPGYVTLVGGRDIIGKRMRDALPEVEAQGFVALLDDVYGTGEPHAGVATPVSLTRSARSDEQQLYLDFVYQPIRDSHGAVTGIFVSGYDVTDRVLTSARLRDEDRRKDEFIAMLGHELRNPLAAIQNAGELLTRTSLSAESRLVGELLARQVTQLGRLVDDLLDVSRITQGRIELHRERLDLDEAIRTAIESVQPQLAAKQHEIVVTAGRGAVEVDGDRARIVQAIGNVLGNAAKYTDPHGRIDVSLRVEGRAAVIEIKDNGMGIAATLLPRIFELFVQGDRAADRSQGGMGIGLSVVRRLVEMHGGEVSAFSAGVGNGSTFQIRLPLAEGPRERGAASAPGKFRTESQRVLVVDDNVDAADSLAALLQALGHEADVAYGSRQALDRASELRPQIVLLDIGLPEMDGYEVAKRLRVAHGAIAIVALTGYGGASDIERARAAGFDAHMTKPVSFEELQAVLAEVGP